MRDIYVIDNTKLNDYKTKFENEKTSFIQGTYKTFSNGYLYTCSDSTIVQMRNNIDNFCKKIQKGYTSISSWLNDYVSDVNNLDNSLKNGVASVKDSSTNSYISSFVSEVKNEVQEASNINDKFSDNNDVTKRKSTEFDKWFYSESSTTDLSLSVDDETKKEQEELQNLLTQYNYTRDALNLELEELKKKRDATFSAETQATEDLDENMTWEDYDKLVKEKEAEVASVEYYIQLTEKQIELVPYYNLEKNEDYEQVLSKVDISNIENYSIEELQNSTVTGAIDYNENVDPLLVAEAVKETFPDKKDNELESDYTVLLLNLDGYDWVSYLDVYKYTTEEQRNIYHYIYETKGRAEADKYLTLLLDDVTKAKATAEADEFISKLNMDSEDEMLDALIELANLYNSENATDAVGAVDSLKDIISAMKNRDSDNIKKIAVQGLLDGAESFNDGLEEAIRNNEHLTVDDYKKAIILEYLQEDDRFISYADIYKISNTTGNMIPVVAASALITAALPEVSITIFGEELAAGQVAGSLLMQTSLFGNAKHIALTNGSDVASANFYAFLTASSETLLEVFFGAVPGISVESGSLFTKMLKEGGEEFVQEYWDAACRAVALGEEIDWADVTVDAIDSYVMGAIMAGIMNGGEIALKVGGEVVKVKVDELMNYMKENPESTPSEALAVLCPPIPINTNSVDYFTSQSRAMYVAYCEFAYYVELTCKERGLQFNQTVLNQVLEAFENRNYDNISSNYVNAAKEIYAKYANAKKVVDDLKVVKDMVTVADIGTCTGKKGKIVYDGQGHGKYIYYYEYVRADGKKVYIDDHFNENGNVANYNINVVISQMEQLKSKSPSLYNKIKEVNFLSIENPGDPYWRAQDPEFTYTCFTGGNGELTVYKPYNNHSDGVNMIAHEAAHMLDDNWVLSNSQEYQNAVRADNNFTSEYARRSFEGRNQNKFGEDFADFIASVTREGPEAAKKKYPNRVEFLRRHSPQVYNELFGGK